MANISQALKAHISSSVTTVATCWFLKCKDGTCYGYTDCDSDLQIDSVNYIASSGFTPSSIGGELNQASTMQELHAILSHESISEQDILTGKYDHAEVEIFLVNYQDLQMGRITLLYGFLGEITLSNNMFHANIYTLIDKLERKIGSLYSPHCRAVFCDDKCKLSREEYPDAQCDKTISTCANVYNNAINFRGEPHVPGVRKLLKEGV